MNILDEANKIVNERSEEKERAYGSFSQGMERAAAIASGMTGKNITAHDMFQCMVALKFSRQSFNHKTDNLLDAVAYLGAWNNYIEDELSSSYPKSPKSEFHEKVSEALKDGPVFADYVKVDELNEYSKMIKREIDRLKESVKELKKDEDYDELNKKIDSVLEEYIPENVDDMKEYLAEDIKHMSPIQDAETENEFKTKFEEEVFGGEKKPSDWSSVSPAQAFRELEEKLQIITDSIIAIHNNMMDVKKETQMNTQYAKYLAENIDQTITYSEYLAEQLEKVTAYSDYLSGELEKVVAKVEAQGLKGFIDTGDPGPG